MFPLLGEPKYQESRLLNSLEPPEEIRMSSTALAVEEPLKIQKVWLVGVSWLG